MKKIIDKITKRKKVDSPSFDAAFLEKIRSILLKEQDRLKKGLLSVNAKDGGNVQYGDEEDDNVKEIEAITVNRPLEMGLESELRDITKALKRLDQGSYGTCKYCDKPIDTRRLLARPTSSSCVTCKKTLTEEA